MEGGGEHAEEDSIGRWRVRQYVGAGAYGTVLRVVEAGRPEEESRALKLAHEPGSPRFEREAELLSRLKHEHVPRLYEKGEWKSPEGQSYPYLVMEWVEGEGLYEWPRQRELSSREAMKVLAQLARALEATHALGGLHRDVKGENVRVSAEGHAKLLDFGASWYPGAKRLTEGVAPGTEPYRSPQVLRAKRQYQRGRGRGPVYAPSDDVYALGVTAYRWLTGRYPEAGRMKPPSKLATVCPELEKLIVRMLSRRAAARGGAGELARALEEGAERGGGEADRPVKPRIGPESAGEGWGSEWPRGALGEAAVVLALVATAVLLMALAQVLPGAREARGGEDPVGLGEGVLGAPVQRVIPERPQPGILLEMPKGPFKGQLRPPCERPEVAIRGGCWIELKASTEECRRYGYEWQEGCYLPSFPPPPQPTSEEP